jgi:hypothetical protein
MPPTLTPERATRAFATTLNTLDPAHLESLLADDFHYASQWVFQEITSKAEYLTYLRGKLETIRRSNSPMFAELGRVVAYGADRPCVVVAQGSREQLEALALVEVADGLIPRIDLCAVPPPQAAERSGEYPGLG